MSIGQKSTIQLYKSYGEQSPETIKLLATELSSRWDFLHKQIDTLYDKDKKHPHYEFIFNLLYHDGNAAWGQVNSWIKLEDSKDISIWMDSMWRSCLKLHDFVRIAEYVCEKEGLDL